MVSYITTKQELFDYILRQLGSEINEIHVTSTNMEDIFQRSLKYFREYGSDAVVDINMILSIANNAREIILDPKIVTINKVLQDNDSSFDFGSPNAFAFGLYSPISDFLFTGINVETSSIVTYRENYKEIRRLRYNKADYDYNPETNKLVLYEDLDKIFMNVTVIEDEDTIYDSEFFLLLMERGAWEMYENNTSKYLNSTIANGISLNTEFFAKKYLELDEKITEARDNEEFDYLGPIRVSNAE